MPTWRAQRSATATAAWRAPSSVSLSATRFSVLVPVPSAEVQIVAEPIDARSLSAGGLTGP